MSQKKVLHVDDDLTILKIVKKRLEGAGYLVTSVSGAENAIKKAAGEKQDLIIIDLYMPAEKEGLGLCQRLTSDPDTKNIPVLFFTNGKLSDIVAKCEKAGALTVILKPFVNEVLDAAKDIFDGTWSKEK